MTLADVLSKFWRRSGVLRQRIHDIRRDFYNIFSDMFAQFQQPRFVIQERVCDESNGQALLTWHFLFQWRGKARCIVGSSHLRFNADGMVEYHRDYWDASEELYEKLPVIGFVLKALKKRAQG